MLNRWAPPGDTIEEVCKVFDMLTIIPHIMSPTVRPCGRENHGLIDTDTVITKRVLTEIGEDYQ